MNPIGTKEMEQHTKSLVIFGATGDLCRRKLIPALFSLHEKNLLPEDFRIIGASRSPHTRQSWLESLGRYYPPEFSLKLEYYSCDLSNPEHLMFFLKRMIRHTSCLSHQIGMLMLLLI